MADTWAALARAIQAIHAGNTSSLSFEGNFRYAYNLVLHKQGKMLYDGVCDLISQNLDKHAKEEITPAFPTTIASGAGEGDPTSQSQQGERLLKAFRKVWDDHESSTSKLRDLLKYMVGETGPLRHMKSNHPYRIGRTHPMPASLIHGVPVYSASSNTSSHLQFEPLSSPQF